MEYVCLDAGKVIASLFVLFAHTEPLHEVSPLAEAVLLLVVMSRFLRWPQMLFLGGVLYAGAAVVYALGTVLLLCESAGDFYRLQGATMDLFLSLVVCVPALFLLLRDAAGGLSGHAIFLRRLSSSSMGHMPGRSSCCSVCRLSRSG